MKHLLYILFVFGSIHVQSQDPQFTQFYANSLHLNPALAGKDLSPRFHSGYRNQWPEIENAYITYNLEYDQFIDKIHGGLGVQFLYDKTAGGIFNTAILGLSYAYQLKLSKGWSVNFALKGNFVQKSIDWSRTIWGDQIDPVRGVVYNTNQLQGQNANYFDAASGLVVFSPKFFGGVAVNHLTRPNESLFFNNNQEEQIPIRTSLHAGYKIMVLRNGLFHKALYISPNLLFDLQSNLKQLNFGSYFVDGILAFGVWYRHTGFINPSGDEFQWQDALVLMAGIEANKMRIGYSYDLNLSSLVRSSLGSHEISITFDLPNKEKKSDKYRVIFCPVF